MIAFDNNVFVYATAAVCDDKVTRARNLIARAMQAGTAVLLLQTLAEFSSVGIGKAKIPPQNIRTAVAAWLAVLPVQTADQSDLLTALDVVRAHRLAFRDAMQFAFLEVIDPLRS